MAICPNWPKTPMSAIQISRGVSNRLLFGVGENSPQLFVRWILPPMFPLKSNFKKRSQNAFLMVVIFAANFPELMFSLQKASWPTMDRVDRRYRARVEKHLALFACRTGLGSLQVKMLKFQYLLNSITSLCCPLHYIPPPWIGLSSSILVSLTSLT